MLRKRRGSAIRLLAERRDQWRLRTMEGSLIGITSVLIPAVVAYLVAKMSNYSKDIIGERTRWREEIRSLTVDAVTFIVERRTNSTEYRKIITNFRVRLNPDSYDDCEIFAILNEGIYNPSDILASKFQATASRLLKHDWERAKYESSLLSIPFILLKSKPSEANIRRLRSRDYLPIVELSRKQKITNHP